MPREVRIYGHTRSVATEVELLDFANEVRKAGGASIIEALLPSEISEPKACLIARALNFECSITPWSPKDERSKDSWPDGSGKWVMVPHRGDPAQCEALARELAKSLNLRLVLNSNEEEDEEGNKVGPKYVYGLMLPKHIGNAASAFDAKAAFQNYAV